MSGRKSLKTSEVLGKVESRSAYILQGFTPRAWCSHTSRLDSTALCLAVNLSNAVEEEQAERICLLVCNVLQKRA